MLKKILLVSVVTVPMIFFSYVSSSNNKIEQVEFTDGSFVDLNSTINSDNLVSRFMLTTDKKVNHLIDIPLRNTWWSRPQEYAWAAQFAGPDYVVLDAGCGISHPFKWFLGKTCKETWACDTDVRLIEKDSIIKETYDDLGEQAYKVVANDSSLWNDVTRIQSPVNTLDEKMPLFDRIFCISMFEDLSEPVREETLNAFAKHLKPDGLIIITCDYPSVSLPHLFFSAKKAGLVPAGPVDVNIPKNALEGSSLKIFRCVLKLDNENN